MIKAYNTKEIMQILDINTRRIVYDIFNSGELKGFHAYQDTGKWLCTEASLMDYIHRQEEKAAMAIEAWQTAQDDKKGEKE